MRLEVQHSGFGPEDIPWVGTSILCEAGVEFDKNAGNGIGE